MSRERSPIANVFRWLWIGRGYIYQAARGKGDDARCGERCVVETVPRPDGGPGNARVRLEGGHVVVVTLGVLRDEPRRSLPLILPVGRDRTSPSKRQRARFATSFAAARDGLLEEVRLMGGALESVS